MANNRLYMQYKYKVEMSYLDLVRNKNTIIRTECIKSVIIDHNYDVNCMPIVFAVLQLDKTLVDDMILNINNNLILMAVYKYNDLTETKEEIEVFRDRFTYFLSDDVNKNESIDYNEINMDENIGNLYRRLTIGLMSVSHINNNKKMIELNVTNNTIYDCVKYCMSHFNNLIIEPFSFNDTYDRIIMPAQESVNKALKYLNSYRVFYYTPFRFYQDFNYTYLISSSGRAIPKNNELYSSVVIQIKDIDEIDANDIGIAVNKASNTYEVLVSYADTNVYDNTLSNKSRTKIKGISSSGSTTKSLLHTTTYLKDKVKNIRLNNDNDNAIYNLEADSNSKNVLLYFSKNDLDMDLLTINKRISVHHIDRYTEHNGDYLLYRKRECLIRENESFIMNTMVNLRKIEKSSTVEVIPFYIK